MRNLSKGMRWLCTAALTLGIGGFPLVGAADITISSDITVDTLWTSDNTYILDTIIFVRDGATLTIEPGTVVRGEPATPGTFCTIGGNSCSVDGDCVE